MESIDWKSCESMADAPEQDKLEAWLKSFHESLGRDLLILELGSYKGQSTALCAQFGQVIAIDLHGNVDHGLRNYEDIGQQHYMAFIQNMVRLKLIERVHLITSTCNALDCFPDIGFDVIYVDASHYYEDVRLDIEKSKRHLRPGGLFIFDDYKRAGWGYPYADGTPPEHDSDPWGGVGHAVDELLLGGGYEVVEHFLGKVCLKKL